MNNGPLLVLARDGERLAICRRAWLALLELAGREGWFAPRVREAGAFSSLMARDFAAVLRNALPDVPDHDALPAPELAREPNVYELLSGPRRGRVQAVAEFCTRGSFRIERKREQV